MLQCAWKSKKARRKVLELKVRKQALLEEASALLVQSRWRIKQAQRRVSGLREQRKEKIRIENASAVVVGSRVRRYLAMRKLFAMQRSYGYVLAVTFKNAADVNVADMNSSDPYILASGLEYCCVYTTAQLLTIVIFLGVVGGPTGTTASMFRTKVISNTLNPVWNEEGFIAGLRGSSDVLVLTMFDKDLVGADDFLGQNVIALKDCSSLRYGEPRDLTLDIGSFRTPLKGVNGEAIPVNGHETPGKGRLNISLRMPKFAYTMCGYMYRLSHSMMSSSWKKRYFILVEKKLHYFEDPAELNSTKGHINCCNVTSIKRDKTKGIDHFTIFYGSGKDKWDIRFVEEDTLDIVEMWKRKISRSCRISSAGTDEFRG